MKVNKYITIYKDMVRQIESGQRKAEDVLPSENDLCDQYGTSRETVRKALNMLAQNGYIQKIKGKGSVILDREKMRFPVSGLISFKELSETLGKETRTTVHRLGLILPPSEAAKELGTEADEKVWEVVRSRRIDGEHIILDKDYFVKKHVPLLTKAICEDSIYEYLEGELGLSISYAQKEIVVEPAGGRGPEVFGSRQIQPYGGREKPRLFWRIPASFSTRKAGTGSINSVSSTLREEKNKNGLPRRARFFVSIKMNTIQQKCAYWYFQK